jgi:hypothetical protein
VGTIWNQPVDTKRFSVRSQEAASRQEQEMSLVQPYRALHGPLPGSGYANQFGPAVPLQHPSKKLGAARRAGVDQDCQPFLAWRSGSGGVQQDPPLPVFVGSEWDAGWQKHFGQA